MADPVDPNAGRSGADGSFVPLTPRATRAPSWSSGRRHMRSRRRPAPRASFRSPCPSPAAPSSWLGVPPAISALPASARAAGLAPPPPTPPPPPPAAFAPPPPPPPPPFSMGHPFLHVARPPPRPPAPQQRALPPPPPLGGRDVLRGPRLEEATEDPAALRAICGELRLAVRIRDSRLRDMERAIQRQERAANVASAEAQHLREQIARLSALAGEESAVAGMSAEQLENCMRQLAATEARTESRRALAGGIRKVVFIQP
eukprot:tig00000985_g6012.t1